jgi:hypothetical protein
MLHAPPRKEQALGGPSLNAGVGGWPARHQIALRCRRQFRFAAICRPTGHDGLWVGMRVFGREQYGLWDRNYVTDNSVMQSERKFLWLCNSDN